MTNGAKIGIVLGSFALVVGGGVAIYFLTKGKKVDSGTNGGVGVGAGAKSGAETQTSELSQKIQSTTEDIKSGIDLLGSIKDLGSALGIGKNKIEIGGVKYDLSGAKETTDKSGGVTYTLKDGTEIYKNKLGVYEVVEEDLSADGEQYYATAMKKSDAKKRFEISKNGILIVK